ncbi:MAG: twin-arginine translocation signal domain-containing protein [Candidatus Nanohaloarchaea archaeon]
MPEDSEEKIEEIVDQKVEEKLHEKLSGEDTGDDYISRKIEEKLQELSETEGDDSDGSLDRRSFLKMLGLGAGGLALASPVSSFIPLASSSGGGGTGTLSDVLSNGNDINGHDIVDSGTTVWDTSAGYVPKAALDTSSIGWSDLSIAQSDVNVSDLGAADANLDMAANYIILEGGFAQTLPFCTIFAQKYQPSHNNSEICRKNLRNYWKPKTETRKQNLKHSSWRKRLTSLILQIKNQL